MTRQEREQAPIIRRAVSYIFEKYDSLPHKIAHVGNKITATHPVTGAKDHYSVCLSHELRGAVIDHNGDADDILDFV